MEALTIKALDMGKFPNTLVQTPDQQATGSSKLVTGVKGCLPVNLGGIESLSSP